MRPLVTSPLSNTSLGRALAVGLGAIALLPASTAIAEEVLPPPPLAEEQAVPPARPVPVVPMVPVTPAVPAVPVAPPAAAQGPLYFNGPVYVIPAPVTAQPLQSLPPLPPPPVVQGPPPLLRRASCCQGFRHAYRPYTPPRGPMVAVGVRFTSMGINQDVFDQRMNLMGGGLQLRFRNQGHFGFETAFDVLYSNIGDGLFKRTSFPFTVGGLFYLFKNRPENHFNIFGTVGVGLQASDIKLYDGTAGRLNQQFLELLAYGGVGAELRFNRLAFTADIRGVALALDENGTAGAYYAGVDGGPIPAYSAGYKANLGALLWF